MTSFSGPEWRRVGGSRLEFSLPLEQFQECLVAGLPPEYAPYVIAGEDRVWSALERRNTAHLYCYPLEQLERALAETPADAGYPRAMVYLGSARLTPELLEPATGKVREWLTLTGLPAVDISQPQPDGRRYVGGLVAVEKVIHVPTGRVVRHEEYSRILRALRRCLRSAVTDTKRGAQGAASTEGEAEPAGPKKS